MVKLVTVCAYEFQQYVGHMKAYSVAENEKKPWRSSDRSNNTDNGEGHGENKVRSNYCHGYDKEPEQQECKENARGY